MKKNNRTVKELEKKHFELAELVPDEKDSATDKQCWFLAKLVLERGDEESIEESFASDKPLTKKDASKEIEFWLKQDVSETKENDEQVPF